VIAGIEKADSWSIGSSRSFPTHIYNLEFKHMVGKSVMALKEYPR
jgi:hypothetical protein